MKTKIICTVIGLAMAMFGFSSSATIFTTGNVFGSPMTITYTEGNSTQQSIYGSGGNFGGTRGATLGGSSLAYVYCIDLFDDINLNTSYMATFTSDGTVSESPAHAFGNANIDGLINNAASIAWLIDTQASLAINGSLQSGLQAAIWTEIYGPMGRTGPNSWNIVGMTASIHNAMTADLAYLALADDFINAHSVALINSVYWIDPTNGALQYQQQVGANQISLSSMPLNPLSITDLGSFLIPEPAFITLLGIGIIGLLVSRYKKNEAR